MSPSLTIDGDILTPAGLVRGTLHIEEGRIARIDGTAIAIGDAGSGGRAILLPGFVDLHVHGAGGMWRQPPGLLPAVPNAQHRRSRRPASARAGR